jgi:hypothetical protein
LPGILLGRKFFKLRQFPSVGCRIEQVLKERAAPAAAGACPEALAQLGCPAGLLDTNEVLDLASRHVKAKADLIVRLHGSVSPLRSRISAASS